MSAKKASPLSSLTDQISRTAQKAKQRAGEADKKSKESASGSRRMMTADEAIEESKRMALAHSAERARSPTKRSGTSESAHRDFPRESGTEGSSAGSAFADAKSVDPHSADELAYELHSRTAHYETQMQYARSENQRAVSLLREANQKVYVLTEVLETKKRDILQLVDENKALRDENLRYRARAETNDMHSATINRLDQIMNMLRSMSRGHDVKSVLASLPPVSSFSAAPLDSPKHSAMAGGGGADLKKPAEAPILDRAEALKLSLVPEASASAAGGGGAGKPEKDDDDEGEAPPAEASDGEEEEPPKKKASSSSSKKPASKGSDAESDAGDN